MTPPVFADSYYYFALIHPGDAGHPKAIAFATSASRHMVVTVWAILELADGMCSVANRPLFTHLFNIIQSLLPRLYHSTQS